jgi:hypothetical protein
LSNKSSNKSSSDKSSLEKDLDKMPVLAPREEQTPAPVSVTHGLHIRKDQRVLIAVTTEGVTGSTRVAGVCACYHTIRLPFPPLF